MAVRQCFVIKCARERLFLLPPEGRELALIDKIEPRIHALAALKVAMRMKMPPQFVVSTGRQDFPWDSVPPVYEGEGWKAFRIALSRPSAPRVHGGG